MDNGTNQILSKTKLKRKVSKEFQLTTENYLMKQ